MPGDRDILEAVNQLTGNQLADKVTIAQCTVESVNIEEGTCNCIPVTGKATTAIEDVKLVSDISDGILIIPSIGSTIFVTYSRFVQPYVSLFSDVDSISFLGGDKGGLVMVVELVNRLNAIENKVNALITKYNSHTHVLTTGTASPTVTQEAGTLTPTKRADIENTKITHGN